MSKSTPATLFLDKAKVAYAVAAYDYDPSADRVGLQAAVLVRSRSAFSHFSSSRSRQTCVSLLPNRPTRRRVTHRWTGRQ